jgi:peptide/nickel transport system substrate-binding protein
VEHESLVVRFQSEPDRIHPLFSRNSTSTQIEKLIFQPLAEFDPYSLELLPVLSESIPESIKITEGSYKDMNALDIRIKPDALWQDSVPVTVEDVLFTLKSILNPKVDVARFRNQLAFINDAALLDKKTLRIYFDANYHNAEIYLMNYFIYPKHICDPNGLLDAYSLAQLKDINAETLAEDHPLNDFAIGFDTFDLSRRQIIGSGPYKLKYWNSGYEIALDKKDNWWGKVHEESNHFKAFPKEVKFKIIPDEQTASMALKSGQIDVLPDLSPEHFLRLMENETDRYQFLTPPLMQYYYLCLNNESEFFKDPKVRKAMVHITNIEEIINLAMKGFGKHLTGPFLPESKDYNQSLRPYDIDIAIADSLLSLAGWEDTNNDGTRDKDINGQRIELIPEINITSSTLGRQIAIILKEQFKKAGIGLDIEVQDFRKSMQDMRSDNFDIVAALNRQAPFVANLKPAWHSAGKEVGGNNLANYYNSSVDSLIEVLVYTRDIEDRMEIHRAIHGHIYNDVPVIFLLMPTERIVVSNKWQARPSTMRPGYFVNLFKSAH